MARLGKPHSVAVCVAYGIACIAIRDCLHSLSSPSPLPTLLPTLPPLTAVQLAAIQLRFASHSKGFAFIVHNSHKKYGFN